MTLTLVTIAPGHQLAHAPAASALRMFAAGCPVDVTEAWRSDAVQAERRAAWLNGTGAFALPVGQSKHPLGYAVDWGRAAATWVRAHPDHGWRFTNPAEWWHTDYFITLDKHLTDMVTVPAPLTPLTQEDDDMKPWIIRRASDGYEVLVTPTGIRGLTTTAAATWRNLGIVPLQPYDAMDDGPFGLVTENLGGVL